VHGGDFPRAEETALLELRDQALDFGRPKEEIHLGQRLDQLVLVPLHHTADADDGPCLPRLFETPGFDEGVDGLLLCRIDEPAGIDEDDLGVVEIRGVFGAAIGEARYVALAVDGVLVAAERDDRDLHRGSTEMRKEKSIVET